MIEHTIAANTEITFKWTQIKEYEFTGYAADLPFELRERVIGRDFNDDALFEVLSENKDLLDTVDMHGMSDEVDNRVDTIDEAFIYS